MAHLLGTFETIFKGLRQRNERSIRRSTGRDWSVSPSKTVATLHITGSTRVTLYLYCINTSGVFRGGGLPWTSEICWFQGVFRLQQVLRPPRLQQVLRPPLKEKNIIPQWKNYWIRPWPTLHTPTLPTNMYKPTCKVREEWYYTI